jgi:hypothetical protein
MSERPWLALGWSPGAPTGWGQFGYGFAQSLLDAGYELYLPAGMDPFGIPAIDRPALQSRVLGMPEDREGWLLQPLGNDLAAKLDFPAHVKVCALCVFEDPGALTDEAVERLKAFDALLAPSRWVQGLLQAKGLPSQVFHQGYDERTFFPVARCTCVLRTRPLHVFSGGKLEFRKGQDIVVEAFKRFRQTPEGATAKLVVAWDNPWPQTMDGIWLSGYVKGVPTVKNGKADVMGWLKANGVPEDAVIDCGKLSPSEMAQVLRRCDVGVFASRAEGATNMVLVEAMACGLPCIVSDGHGHSDAPKPWATITGDRTVPGGCRLYRSTEGWTEVDPAVVVSTLQLFVRVAPVHAGPLDGWGWDELGPKLAELVLEPAAVRSWSWGSVRGA